MNTASTAIKTATGECASKLNRLARENPARAILAAIGCGLAIGLLVRAMNPPKSRTARLLEDIAERLHDIAAPVQRKAGHLAESGAGAVRSGVAHLHDLHIERGLRSLGKRCKSLFR